MKLTCYQCDNQWNWRYDRDPITCPKCGKEVPRWDRKSCPKCGSERLEQGDEILFD